uniref:NPC2-3 n=1 Tax=Pardosa pseudoannulata TaxID=330961 RepID=A0A411AIR4_9ARAC|nr:NPC2-3 [Pardosa pseudoannulata]
MYFRSPFRALLLSNMNYLVLFALVFSLPVKTSSSPYELCESPASDINYLNVTDCDDSREVCILKRGTQVTIQLSFNSQKDFKKLRAHVYGIISGNLFPFSLKESDACKNGIPCPFTAGQTGTYINQIDVKIYYPPIPVTVRWELRDENGDDIVCIDINCEID